MNAPGFVGGWFDRADRLRISGEADGALQGRMDARLLLLNGLDPQFDARGELNWGPLFDAPEGAGLLFLGLDEAERPCYCALADLPRGVAPLNRHLWPGLTALPPDQASLYATARSLVDWHNRHRFCAVCGSETQVVKAGWSRHCAACGAEHFPRVDPVVIMLVEHDGKVLLGRQPRFPKRQFSALAGFIEPGETIEGAVIRELHEEAGIRAHSVRYVASQPWPFPSSLMIGCLALTDDPAITLDEQELEEAIWVSAAEVRDAMDGGADASFGVPPPLAIAHYLLRAWLDEMGV